MEKLTSIANQYVKESDWKLIAMLKICLLSFGMILGISMPKKYKKIVFTIGIPVFFITYVPLMAKLYRLVKENLE